MSYGLIFRQNPDPRRYVLGGGMLPYETLRPDGNWEPLAPEYESQNPNGWDTFGCQIFGTVKIFEMLVRHRTGERPNYSERYHYNAIPIRPPGGDPQAAADSVRRIGMVDQAALPMTGTFEDYTAPTPLTPELLAEGAAWRARWEPGHEDLWHAEPPAAERNEILRWALKSSPVGISVTAWRADENGHYADYGLPNNHWCVLVDIEARPEGDVLRVLDSYDGQIKLLAPGHRIQVAKRYRLAAVESGAELAANPVPMYSQTQSANLLALAGLIATVVSYFGFEAKTEEITVALSAIVALVGIARAWFVRYNKGDVTFGGYYR